MEEPVSCPGFCIHFFQPGAHAEETDVLGYIVGFGIGGEAVDRMDTCFLFFPVAVAVSAQRLVQEVTGQSGGCDDHYQQRVDVGQHYQIDEESQRVLEKAGHGSPDGFSRCAVAV